VTETVAVDENVIVYHAVKKGGQATIINDFDRKIQVAKVETSDGGVTCLVSALNRSMLNEQTDRAEVPRQDNSSSPIDYFYERIAEPIRDIAFLGERVSNLCNNIPTYWEVPSCQRDSVGERQKRSICYYCYHFYYYCYYCSYYYYYYPYGYICDYGYYCYNNYCFTYYC